MRDFEIVMCDGMRIPVSLKAETDTDVFRWVFRGMPYKVFGDESNYFVNPSCIAYVVTDKQE